MDYTVRKQGENQCVGFVASFIDDSYIPGGEQLLEPVAELLGELLCDPVTERGRFVTAYFEGEKTNLIDAIRSQVNDKREYAYARLLREMCDRGALRHQPPGRRGGCGEAADAKAPRPVRRAACHRQAGAVLLRQRIPGAGTEALAAAFATLPRDGIRDIAPSTPHPARTEVKRVEEAMDVTQGKLGMALPRQRRLRRRAEWHILFGGSSNSKLF